MVDGDYTYKLGRVITGNGFKPYEGTVVRESLIEALKEFYKLPVNITAINLEV
jgi:hypothetical protein